MVDICGRDDTLCDSSPDGSFQARKSRMTTLDAFGFFCAVVTISLEVCDHLLLEVEFVKLINLINLLWVRTHNPRT